MQSTDPKVFIDPTDSRYVFIDGRRLARVAGGDGTDEPAGGTDPNAGADPAAGGADPAAAAAESAAGAQPKTYSQEEIDRIVQDRLARDRKDRPSQEQIDEWKAAHDSQLSDADKLKQENDELKAQNATAAETTKKALVKAAVMTEAIALDVKDPAALIEMLPADAVTVDDDGQVTGAKEAVETAIARAKALVGDSTPNPGGGDGGARPGPTTKTLDQQIAEAESKGDWELHGRLNAQKLAGLKTKE